LHAVSDNPYIKRYPSPTGAHAVVTVDNEVKMSHWISEPTLVDANDQAVLEFTSSWSADEITWLDAGHVKLAMRHYPGDRDAVVTIDIAARTVTLGDGRVLDFTAFRAWLR